MLRVWRRNPFGWLRSVSTIIDTDARGRNTHYVIDNYQGEESDIVLVSLTRSNSTRDIGFMFAPERLNVLLSRARDALIMIGNGETFSTAKKGGELWTRFLTMLRKDGHIYDGLPTRCERHSAKTALLKIPADFDEYCPDGGCSEPWYVLYYWQQLLSPNLCHDSTSMLNCGVHQCPSKCHQLYDHSKMTCEAVMEVICPNNHKRTYRCHQPPPSTCGKCLKAAELADKKKQKDFEKQQKRDGELREHAKRIAELDAEIEAEQEQQKDRELARQRADAIAQKQKDLADAKSRAARKAAQASKSPPNAQATPAPPRQAGGPAQPPLRAPTPTQIAAPQPATPAPHSEPQPLSQPAPRPPTPRLSTENNDPPPLPPSKAEQEWQRQKDIDGADNEHIDAIMTMTGLEKVKEQVLRIKAKIDTSLRQGTSVKDERFNIALLGNPGTGTSAKSTFPLLRELTVRQVRQRLRDTTPNSWLPSTCYLGTVSSKQLGLA